MNNNNCPTVLVWGISDPISWIPSASNYIKGEPLLFDAYFSAKPAFFSVRDIYQETASTLSVEENITVPQSNPPYVDVYNLLGQKVASQISRSEVRTLPSGLYIVNGKKVYIR
uniref:Glyco_hydro_10 n=1 Tax=uncultured Halorhabdus sp. TaxID=643678 RepID=A0A060BNQ9_9EURY|nr:Glyco_hydro_10 [uncultured Halorhabdus sp.]